MISARALAPLLARAVGPVLASIPLMALTQVPGPIVIGPSWGSLGDDGRSGALYTTIVNRGVLPDRLAGIACPGYGDVSEADLPPSTQGARPQDKGVLIPRGGKAVLGPEGAHIALSNIRTPLHDGALVPCTLSFVRSGERLVVFTIGQPGPAVDEP